MIDPPNSTAYILKVEADVMAQCAHGMIGTEVYDGGKSIGRRYSEERQRKGVKKSSRTKSIQNLLVDHIVEATARVTLANQTFSDVMSQVPSGLPHPDGTQRIRNASRELFRARKEMMTAHRRLDNFIESGIVPEDLKWNG